MAVFKPIGEVESPGTRKVLVVVFSIIIFAALPFLLLVTALANCSNTLRYEWWPDAKEFFNESVSTIKSAWKGDFVVDKPKESV